MKKYKTKSLSLSLSLSLSFPHLFYSDAFEHLTLECISHLSSIQPLCDSCLFIPEPFILLMSEWGKNRGFFWILSPPFIKPPHYFLFHTYSLPLLIFKIHLMVDSKLSHLFEKKHKKKQQQTKEQKHFQGHCFVVGHRT